MIAFFATAVVFAFSPGPAMIYTIGQTIAYGRTAGIKAALGVHLASYLHILLAATGAGLLIQHSEDVHHILKLSGCLYLLSLGTYALISKPAVERGPSSAPQIANAFMVELLNPKSILFFISFLPQYIDSESHIPLWIQMCLYGAVANLIFSLAEVAVVMMTQPLRRLSTLRVNQTVLKNIGSFVLIGLGAHLLFQHT